MFSKVVICLHVRVYSSSMPTSQQLEQLEKQILTTIETIRDKYSACTARSVASVLNLSPDVVRYRCVALKNQGLINWNDMPGSLHVVKPKRGRPPAEKQTNAKTLEE